MHHHEDPREQVAGAGEEHQHANHAAVDGEHAAAAATEQSNEHELQQRRKLHPDVHRPLGEHHQREDEPVGHRDVAIHRAPRELRVAAQPKPALHDLQADAAVVQRGAVLWKHAGAAGPAAGGDVLARPSNHSACQGQPHTRVDAAADQLDERLRRQSQNAHRAGLRERHLLAALAGDAKHVDVAQPNVRHVRQEPAAEDDTAGAEVGGGVGEGDSKRLVGQLHRQHRLRSLPGDDDDRAVDTGRAEEAGIVHQEHARVPSGESF